MATTISSGAAIGYVEFSAYYRDRAGEHEMRERSEFRRINGVWVYWSGSGWNEGVRE